MKLMISEETNKSECNIGLNRCMVYIHGIYNVTWRGWCFYNRRGHVGTGRSVRTVRNISKTPYPLMLPLGEPRRPSGLKRWFANATHQGTGSRIPPLPRAEFGRLTLEWHNWLVTPREGGGLSNLDARIKKKKHLGLLELRQMCERMRLEEGVSPSGSLDPLRAARDKVYAVDLRLAWGG